MCGCNSRNAWEMHRNTATRPKLTDMIAYLERRATGLAGVSSTALIDTGAFKISRSNDTPEKPTCSVVFDRKQQPGGKLTLPPCPLCRADHGLFRCSEFLKMKLAARLEFVRKAQLCLNCLRTGHAADKCPKTQYACKNCNGDLHNMSICPKRKHFIDGEPQVSAVVSQQIAPPTNTSVFENNTTKDE